MKLLIIDDHTFVCEAFARYIHDNSHHITNQQVDVTTATDLETGIGILREGEITHVFLDLGMGVGLGGADTLAHVQEQNAHGVPVSVFTGLDITPTTAPVFSKCLALYACGIMLKSADPEEMFKGLSRILTGEPWVPERIMRAIAVHSNGQSSSTENQMGLTDSQWKIYCLMARGMMDKEIARELGLAPGYVRQVNSRIFARLGVRNRMEAVQRYPRAKA